MCVHTDVLYAHLAYYCSMDTSPDPTRLSVNITPETATVMRAMRDTRGLTYTEQIRRGVQAYDYLSREVEHGGTVMIKAGDGSLRELVML